MPNKEFKLMVINMLTGLERRIEELSGNLDKDRKCKKQPNRNEDYNN